MTASGGEKADKGEGYRAKPNEVAAFQAMHESLTARPLPPEITVKKTGDQVRLGAAHENHVAGLALQTHAMGLRVTPSLTHIMRQMAAVTRKNGEVNQTALNEMFYLVEGIAPTDTVECLLATQMVTVHDAAMAAAERLRTADTLEHVAAFGKQTEKLSRTFAALVDTLKGYRSKSEQRVVVEHKHYHLHQDADGAGVGGETEKELKPHVRSVSERQAMHGEIEAERPALPGSSGDRVVSLPVSRRARRSAVGAS